MLFAIAAGVLPLVVQWGHSMFTPRLNLFRAATKLQRDAHTGPDPQLNKDRSDLPPARLQGGVVHDCRLAGRKCLPAGTGGEAFLVALKRLGA